MITKNDCILLLADIADKGTDTTVVMRKLLSSSSVDMNIIKFINDVRPFEVGKFYEQLRYNYNHKKFHY